MYVIISIQWLLHVMCSICVSILKRHCGPMQVVWSFENTAYLATSGILPSCHVNWCTLNREKHILHFLLVIHLVIDSQRSGVGHCVPQLNVLDERSKLLIILSSPTHCLLWLQHTALSWLDWLLTFELTLSSTATDYRCCLPEVLDYDPGPPLFLTHRSSLLRRRELACHAWTKVSGVHNN